MSVIHRLHVASISFEIQMCLKSRQNKGRIKGSLDLIVSLKTEIWIFLVTPSEFSVPGGFNRWWRTGPFSGEGFSDTGTRASEPPGRTEIATRASGNETGTPAHSHSSPVLLQAMAGSGLLPETYQQLWLHLVDAGPDAVWKNASFVPDLPQLTLSRIQIESMS